MLIDTGKRQCLGEGMARINTFLGVAYLMQMFDFDKVPGEKYDMSPRHEAQILNLPRPFKVLITPRS